MSHIAERDMWASSSKTAGRFKIRSKKVRTKQKRIETKMIRKERVNDDEIVFLLRHVALNFKLLATSARIETKAY